MYPPDYTQGLIDYQKKMIVYHGLFMKAVTDIADKETIGEIVDRHFQLMKEEDEKRNGDASQREL